MKFINCTKFDWQYPAITEKFAYECLLGDAQLKDSDAYYIAYPWATIIDIYHKDWKDYKDINEFLDKNLSLTPVEHHTVITVCQTYNFRKFLPYFKKIGINILFAPHATKYDYFQNKEKFGIEILPFPLYPVYEASVKRHKDLLYSFIGNIFYNGEDKDNNIRVESLRKDIVEKVAHPENTVIKSIDKWHFQDTVYKKQIYGQTLQESEVFEEKNRSKEYSEVLSRSIFSLCPRGIGPSSIRFWESLNAGSIPVVIADDLWLPDGKTKWHDAVVFISESNLKDIPRRLSLFSKDDIAKRKANIDKVKTEFLGSSFINPIKYKLQNKKRAKKKEKYSLFIPFYRVGKESRLSEYVVCLTQNLNNSSIKDVYILYEYCSGSIESHEAHLPDIFKHKKVYIEYAYRDQPRQLSYLDFIKYANRVLEKNEHFIIANSDIFFDESLSLLDNLDNPNHIYALTRYNIQPYKTFQKLIWKRNQHSQDSWFLRTPFKEKKDYDINLGWIGCDNRIAYEFDKAGFEVLNISESVKSWHVHDNTDQQHLYDSIKSYKYSGKPYKFLPLTSIEEIKSPKFQYKRIKKEERMVHEWQLKCFREELQRLSEQTGYIIGAHEYKVANPEYHSDTPVHSINKDKMILNNFNKLDLAAIILLIFTTVVGVGSYFLGFNIVAIVFFALSIILLFIALLYVLRTNQHLLLKQERKIDLKLSELNEEFISQARNTFSNTENSLSSIRHDISPLKNEVSGLKSLFSNFKKITSTDSQPPVIKNDVVPSRPKVEFKIPTVYDRMRHAGKLGFKPKVIIDGGANRGKWTKWTSTIFKDAQYLCVEPNHTLNSTIKETIANNTSNYSIENVALGKDMSQGILNIWGDSSGASLLDHVDGTPGTVIETEIITIDELCKRKGVKPDLIKLDLQGGEMDALLGAKESLKTCEMVIPEFGCLYAYIGRTSNAQMMTYLEELGFGLYDVVDIHYRPYDGALTGGDFIFVKNDSILRKHKGYK